MDSTPAATRVAYIGIKRYGIVGQSRASRFWSDGCPLLRKPPTSPHARFHPARLRDLLKPWRCGGVGPWSSQLAKLAILPHPRLLAPRFHADVHRALPIGVAQAVAKLIKINDLIMDYSQDWWALKRYIGTKMPVTVLLEPAFHVEQFGSRFLRGSANCSTWNNFLPPANSCHVRRSHVPAVLLRIVPRGTIFQSSSRLRAPKEVKLEWRRQSSLLGPEVVFSH